MRNEKFSSRCILLFQPARTLLDKKEKKTMSFKMKLQFGLGTTFILAIAGAISIMAQTQKVADPLRTNETANVALTSDPKKVSAKESSAASLAETSNRVSEAKPDDGNSNTAANPGVVTTAPTDAKSAPPKSPQGTATDKWQFVFSPYFWMAGLHGTTGGPNRTVQLDESFGDIFHSLKFAFMGVFEAHKGKLAVQTDLEYVSLEDEKATPGPLFSNANAKIKTFVFTPEVGYRFYNDTEKGSFVEVLGGTRIWHMSSDLSFGAGVLPASEIKNSRTWVDGVAGLRGKAALTEKVFFIGRFDLGGGGSKFTYQLFGGLGYNINKKIALVGGYRVLDVNYDKNNFVYDTNQRGPILGVGFKF
jgi:hypothetical protein